MTLFFGVKFGPQTVPFLVFTNFSFHRPSCTPLRRVAAIVRIGRRTGQKRCGFGVVGRKSVSGNFWSEKVCSSTSNVCSGIFADRQRLTSRERSGLKVRQTGDRHCEDAGESNKTHGESGSLSLSLPSERPVASITQTRKKRE